MAKATAEKVKTAQRPKCKRCKDATILVVDRGYHYIKCPDCHPAYAEIRRRQADAPKL